MLTVFQLSFTDHEYVDRRRVQVFAGKDMKASAEISLFRVNTLHYILKTRNAVQSYSGKCVSPNLLL